MSLESRVLRHALRARAVATAAASLMAVSLPALSAAADETAAPAQASPASPETPDGTFAGPFSSDSLHFNGFGTLGLVDVSPHDDWGLRRETTQPSRHDDGLRADVDSRLGLQATWRPHPQVDVVGQVVLKPEAHDAHWTEAIAWAYAAWHPTSAWTIRAGRTSPDLFLLADARNVGFSYPWIRPNGEFYSWMPLQNVDGLDASYQGELGPGRWIGKVFIGRSAVTFAGAHDRGDTRVTVEPLSGGTLSWEDGRLTVKATWARAVTRPMESYGLGQLHDALGQVAALPIPSVAADAATLQASFPGARTFVTHYASLGASLDTGDWIAHLEAARTTGNFTTSNAWYGYGSLGYRVGPATVFGMAGHARTSRSPLPDPQWQAILAPLVGPVAAAGAQQVADTVSYNTNISRVDQDSLSVGLRWDLAAQWALKGQVDRIRTAAYGGGLWGYDTYAPHHATVLSLGLDFVF